MQLNEQTMNDAMKIRTSIEYAIRSIFDIPQDIKNTATNIDRLKKHLEFQMKNKTKLKKFVKLYQRLYI